MIELQKKKNNTIVYVYYNVYNGKIKTISHDKNLSFDIDVETFETNLDNHVISEIYKGNLDSKNYLVDITSEILSPHRLIRKDNILRLKQSNELIKLDVSTDEKLDSEWDISIKVYKNNKMLVINLHAITVKNLTKFDGLKKIILSENDVFLIFKIYDLNNEIVKEIKLPFKMLLPDKRGILIDISDIMEKHDINDLQMYTNKMFENYVYKIIKSDYIEFNHNLRKNFILVKSKKEKSKNHILIEYNNEGMTVINNIDELISVVYDDYMYFWVIKNNPNHLIETIKVNVNDLLKDKKCVVKTKSNLLNEEFDLVHNYSQLIIEKEK